jgi:hypothetical protein
VLLERPPRSWFPLLRWPLSAPRIVHHLAEPGADHTIANEPTAGFEPCVTPGPMRSNAPTVAGKLPSATWWLVAKWARVTGREIVGC